MKIRGKTTKKIFLELDKAEALWLQGLMQNPVMVDNMGNDMENAEESENRRNLFEGLKQGLES